MLSEHTLYIVATPIGHREDLSARAVETLRAVTRIYAEDTRHSLPLMRHHGIETRLHALHEHNEAREAVRIVEHVTSVGDAALITDAGTPLISDPGFRVVRECRRKGRARVAGARPLRGQRGAVGRGAPDRSLPVRRLRAGEGRRASPLARAARARAAHARALRVPAPHRRQPRRSRGGVRGGPRDDARARADEASRDLAARLDRRRARAGARRPRPAARRVRADGRRHRVARRVRRCRRGRGGGLVVRSCRDRDRRRDGWRDGWGDGWRGRAVREPCRRSRPAPRSRSIGCSTCCSVTFLPRPSRAAPPSSAACPGASPTTGRSSAAVEGRGER